MNFIIRHEEKEWIILKEREEGERGRGERKRERGGGERWAGVIMRFI